jgi:hypothetical protein
MTSKKKTKLIHSLDEIPTDFASEDEERDWWANHELSEELLNSMEETTEELDRLFPWTMKKTAARAARRG